MKTIQFSWAVISGLGLALLILSKTLERLLYGLAQERLLSGLAQERLLCGLGLGLAFLNLNWARLGWAGPY